MALFELLLFHLFSHSHQVKYRGTLVTVESFKAWRERFEEEIGEKKGRKKDETVATSGRLTGEADSAQWVWF